MFSWLAPKWDARDTPSLMRGKDNSKFRAGWFIDGRSSLPSQHLHFYMVACTCEVSPTSPTETYRFPNFDTPFEARTVTLFDGPSLRPAGPSGPIALADCRRQGACRFFVLVWKPPQNKPCH